MFVCFPYVYPDRAIIWIAVLLPNSEGIDTLDRLSLIFALYVVDS